MLKTGGLYRVVFSFVSFSVIEHHFRQLLPLEFVQVILTYKHESENQ